MKSSYRVWAVLIGFAVSVAAAEGEPSPSFGTSGESQYVVTAWDMQPAISAMQWENTASGYRFRSGPSGEFIGAAHVPQGSLIFQLALYACDSSIEGQVTFSLLRADPAGTTLLATVATGTLETPGCTFVEVGLPVPETVDNASYRYLVVGSNETADGQTTFGDVHVVYRLQVSPAPTFGSFNDVPTSDPGFQFIEALYFSGITGGCGNGNYCPDAPLTRRQMAVFLSKALGLYWPDGVVN